MARRFAGANKLLLPLAGRSVVRRTVDAYCAASLATVLVVVGYEAEAVAAEVRATCADVIHNPDFEQGQSRALVRGVYSLSSDTEAAVIGVGDQPLLHGQVIRSLVDAWRSSGAPLVAPRYAGRRGNPVVFGRQLFPDLLAVTGDQGGRPVIERYGEDVVWVQVESASIGEDVDTVEAYERLRAELEGPHASR
jgi:molybdenum cofactor cytidylyltransferase